MKCGYAIREITPPVGCYISGSGTVRVTEKVADPLYVRAVAFEAEEKAVILCYDLIGFLPEEAMKARTFIAGALGLPEPSVVITCTHTHNAPNIHSRFFPKTEYLMTSMKDMGLAAAQAALTDLKEAKAYYDRSILEGITFNRRYRMKDGSVLTNPGRRNPNILEPLTPPDEVIQLLKFEREGGEDIILINFQIHACIRGGSDISADFPAVVCNTLEGALPGTRCIFFNGAYGDLNHINVNAPVWDKNGGPSEVLHVGRNIAGKILQMYTKARPMELETVKTGEKYVSFPSRSFTEEELANARFVMDLYLAGRRDEIPLGDRSFTVVLYEALGIIQAWESGGTYCLPVTGISLGDMAFLGLPGEIFSETGIHMREQSPQKVVFVLGLVMGYPDYFPTMDAYLNGGYETASSPYGAGVAEKMEAAVIELAKELQ